MKNVVLVLSCVFFIGCGFGNGPDQPLIYLIAGQSNSVSPAQMHPPHYSVTGLVRVNDIYHGNEFRVPTVDNPMDSSIAWIYLGDMMEKPVTFVNVGQGNTSTRKWRTSLYPRILDQLKKQTITSILWVQGESDFLEGISEQETYENLKWLILESQRVQNGVKWYVALNSFKSTPKENSVRRAEKRIIAEGYATEGPDTDVMRDTPTFMEPSGAEFVGEGLREHARLWFEVLN